MNLPSLPIRLFVVAAVLSLAGCASDPETRNQLRQVHSVSVNGNVEFYGGGGAAGDQQIRSLEQSLIGAFMREVNRAGVFPQPVVIVRASLETWREEVGEMNYDGQFKLKIRQGAKEGVWEVQAILQSRAGLIVWRSGKTAKAGVGGLDASAFGPVCNALVMDLQRARR